MKESRNTVEELIDIAEYYERGQSEIALIRDQINRTAQHVGALHFDPNTNKYYICYGRINGEFKWVRLRNCEPGEDLELDFNEPEQD
jgi:hypothetical protein